MEQSQRKIRGAVALLLYQKQFIKLFTLGQGSSTSHVNPSSPSPCTALLLHPLNAVHALRPQRGGAAEYSNVQCTQWFKEKWKLQRNGVQLEIQQKMFTYSVTERNSVDLALCSHRVQACRHTKYPSDLDVIYRSTVHLLSIFKISKHGKGKMAKLQSYSVTSSFGT